MWTVCRGIQRIQGKGFVSLKATVKHISYWPRLFGQYIYGWILSKLFLPFYGPRQSPWRSIKTKAQKRRRPISSHLKRTSLVNKGFIREIARGQDGLIFPAWVANQNTRFRRFIFPPRVTSHIYTTSIPVFNLLFSWTILIRQYFPCQSKEAPFTDFDLITLHFHAKREPSDE